MTDSNNSRNAYVKFVEDEDIYIDCRPVDTTGEVIVKDDDDKDMNVGNIMLDDITDNMLNGNIFNDVGFQTLLGVTILGMLYGIGSYVFRDLPTKFVNKKMYSY